MTAITPDTPDDRRRNLALFGIDDARIEGLITFLRDHHHGGFANNVIFGDELLAALQELEQFRARPAHCPCCDGDHL